MGIHCHELINLLKLYVSNTPTKGLAWEPRTLTHAPYSQDQNVVTTVLYAASSIDYGGSVRV